MANSILFKSDRSLSEEVYKETRSKYIQFNIGILLIIASAAGIIYDAYNQYLWISYGCDTLNILIHVAVLLALILAIVLSVFIILSGGKNELIKKSKENVYLYDDHILIYYILKKGKYKAIQKNIYFCDLQSIFYEGEKKRLILKSDIQIKKAADIAAMKSDEDVIEEDEENCTVYIYDKFRNFDQMMKEIERLSLKKIESDISLY